ncbi:sugar phosphate isomerase/epimerase family protein [Pseudomonas sp. EpS/L25]|uniref:sugar phosphate isomerase/epimerase family protein n=1 Tax=Pseudomonas sp. EpS/L25 TaxID=1749078 RepID=UPI000743807D|nr:TIM barrel protein [Pseudomonas sp. EpS/L25]KUM43903.1 AP endonuclease [Pseudomonas sp. EpS/L25]
MPPEIAITTSAFGADVVRPKGQAAWLDLIAATGASHVEIRAELFDGEPDFDALRAAIAAAGLGCVYSVPLELWPAAGATLSPHLPKALEEARRLGADTLKVSLGHYRPAADLTALATLLAGAGPQLLVENDQTVQGGRLEPLRAFIQAARAAQLPVGLTFDVGNWRWQNEDPLQAARLLGPDVRYLHCKAVRRRAGGLHAVPPEAADLLAWQGLMGYFPAGLRRAIEFPLMGADLLAEARRQVATLRTFDSPQEMRRHG